MTESNLSSPPLPTASELHEPTVRALLALFQVEGSDFYHNEPNDYGVINVALYSGMGDPFAQYAGPEVQGEYAVRGGAEGETEYRGTGSYSLNEAAVRMVMNKLKQRARPANPLPKNPRPRFQGNRPVKSS
jgi:hypothetical protein